MCMAFLPSVLCIAFTKKPLALAGKLQIPYHSDGSPEADFKPRRPVRRVAVLPEHSISRKTGRFGLAGVLLSPFRRVVRRGGCRRGQGASRARRARSAKSPLAWVMRMRTGR
ncbi:hypothetical protein Acidovoranil_07280 [Acidovorax sp. FG27]